VKYCQTTHYEVFKQFHGATPYQKSPLYKDTTDWYYPQAGHFYGSAEIEEYSTFLRDNTKNVFGENRPPPYGNPFVSHEVLAHTQKMLVGYNETSGLCFFANFIGVRFTFTDPDVTRMPSWYTPVPAEYRTPSFRVEVSFHHHDEFEPSTGKIVARQTLIFDGHAAAVYDRKGLNRPSGLWFTCQAMKLECPQVWSYNGLRTQEECFQRMLALPLTDLARGDTKPGTRRLFITGRNSGCTMVHSALLVASKNGSKHCPHISFRPYNDSRGRTLCQNTGPVFDDIYEHFDLEFIRLAHRFNNKYHLNPYSEDGFIIDAGSTGTDVLPTAYRTRYETPNRRTFDAIHDYGYFYGPTDEQLAQYVAVGIAASFAGLAVLLGLIVLERKKPACLQHLARV